MSRTVPNERSWNALSLFSFQVYPFIALFIHFVFRGIWPHGKAYADHFETLATCLVLGSAVSLIVLILVTLAQLTSKRYYQALCNAAFAVLNIVVVLICLPGFVR